MTTRDFLYKAFNETTRKTFCSSVFVSKGFLDGQITAYSYGYHYPLATIIDGKGYVNNRGYSNSTAKHINWAFSALGEILGYDNVYGVKLTNGDSLTLEGIKNSAKREMDDVKAQMAKKKRKDTQVYNWLQHQLKEASQTLATV